MRYFTWKFDWAQEGTDPTYVVNSTGARLEPQFSSLPVEDVNALIYGYLLYGDFDLATVSTWNVIEITATQMLAAAQELIPAATMDATGQVVFPTFASDLSNPSTPQAGE